MEYMYRIPSCQQIQKQFLTVINIVQMSAGLKQYNSPHLRVKSVTFLACLAMDNFVQVKTDRVLVVVCKSQFYSVLILFCHAVLLHTAETSDLLMLQKMVVMNMMVFPKNCPLYYGINKIITYMSEIQISRVFLKFPKMTLAKAAWTTSHNFENT